MREFAENEHHKFVTFEQDDVIFAILGMSRPDNYPLPQQNAGYVSPKSGAVRSAASPPTIKLKIVDQDGFWTL